MTILPSPNNTDQLQVFRFGELTLRALLLEGEPWFVLSDLVKALGLTSTARVAERLRPKGVSKTHTLTAGGRQQVTIIDEGNLYRVIMRSNSPVAERFESWVTDEVLPAIRKTGTYQVPLSLEERALSVITDLTAQVEEQRALNAQQAAELEAARPAVEYVETQVLKDDDVLTVKDWGYRFGLTQPQAYKLLTERQVLSRKLVGERWSQSKGRKEKEFEYRPYAAFRELFVVRGQHNAPRLHNGQIRQTTYVKAFYSLDLARRVGILNEVEVAA